MNSQPGLNVSIEHSDFTITYGDSGVLRAGVVHDVQLGPRPRSSRKIIGFIALNRYEFSTVRLTSDKAERLSWFYDYYYRATCGEQLSSFDIDETDCHSFVNFVHGLTSFVSPGAYTPYTALDTQTVSDPAALLPGHAYGLYNDKEYVPDWPNQHSVLAVDDGSRSVSVIGTNGFMTVAENQHLRDFYRCTRISPLTTDYAMAAIL